MLSAKKKEEEIVKYLKTLESEAPAMPSAPKYGDVHESYSNMFYEELSRDSISEISRNIEFDDPLFPRSVALPAKHRPKMPDHSSPFNALVAMPDLLARRKFRLLQLL